MNIWITRLALLVFVFGAFAFVGVLTSPTVSPIANPGTTVVAVALMASYVAIKVREGHREGYAEGD